MKFRVVLTAITMALLLPLSTSSVRAGPSGIELQGNPDGSFSISGDFISLAYYGDSSPTFDSVGISKSSVIPVFEPLFESIDVQAFLPASDPIVSGESVQVSSDELAVEFHNNPMATIGFKAVDQSLVTFAFEEEIGAIVDSQLARLGKGGTTGELVTIGDATLEKSFNQIRLRMNSGGRCYFRASVVPDEFVGQEISLGTIVGELYLTQIESNVVTDLIQYDSVSLSPSFVSAEKVAIEVSGEFSAGKVVVLSLDRAMFTVPADNLFVHVDGEEVARAGSLEQVFAGGSGSTFFVSHDEGTLEVFVFLPHFSEHTVVLSGEGTAAFPWSILAAALGATLVLLVATAYLFKKKY